MALRQQHIRWMALGAATILSLPFMPCWISGAYMWMSPSMLLVALCSGKWLAWMNILALGILIIVMFRKRWICRFACPAGALCDLASALGRRPQVRVKFQWNRLLAIAGIGLTLAGLPLLILTDPMNLYFMAFEGFRSGWGAAALLKLSGILLLVLISLLFPHLWCASICPLGGLQLLLYDLRGLFFSRPSWKDQLAGGRRLFLAGITGAAAGLVFRRFIPSRKNKVIRPPFALDETRLNATCVRCGNCTSVCPTGIIRPSLDPGTPERVLTPVVEFRDSYCLEKCNACGMACPSGAIRRFRAEEKNTHVMGMARVDPVNCYLRSGRECSLCKDHCEYGAITFTRDDPLGPWYPSVDELRCVGCGACQVICPPGAITIDPPA